VHKVGDAASTAGLRLEVVIAEAEAAAAAVGTMGVALGPCTVRPPTSPALDSARTKWSLGSGSTVNTASAAGRSSRRTS